MSEVSKFTFYVFVCFKAKAGVQKYSRISIIQTRIIQNTCFFKVLLKSPAHKMCTFSSPIVQHLSLNYQISTEGSR